MDHLDFSYKIETVGLKDVGDFKDVVCEFRYYFIGTNKKAEIKQRFYVLQVDTSNLNVGTFIPVDKLNIDILYDWIDKGINPTNKYIMKKSIYDLFHPEIRYVSQQFFSTLPEEKDGPVK